MITKCYIEELQKKLQEEAAAKGNWEEYEDWRTASDVKIIQTALRRCTEYIEKELKATYYT